MFKGLVRSDHMAIIVNPCLQAKPERKHVYFRDVREHRKINMEKCLQKCDWSAIYKANNVDEATTLLNDKIFSISNECFPLIKVKVSTHDPPYMSPLVKHLCNKRNKQIKIMANPDIQERINKLIRLNQIRSVNEENRKFKQDSLKWWDTVNKITGRRVNSNNLSFSIDPKVMNDHFHNINTDPHYSTIERLSIPEGTRIPVVDISMVEHFMMKQKKSAPGPDGIPYWIWRDYAQYLAPIITRILNFSLSRQYVPQRWKLANIAPIPKESPVTECSQLRPISLTDIIMRILEKVVFKQEIYPQAEKVIDDDQFAYKEGTSTTTALIKCQHNWLNADYVRVISFDLSKAFDTVPHDIICGKLKATDLNPYIINWIINFLSDRKQRVVVDGIETEFVHINRGVPQGTVLGPFLFSLMVNDIKPKDPENNMLVKFADDMTVSALVKDTRDTASNEV